jgi:hypothetical protein
MCVCVLCLCECLWLHLCLGSSMSHAARLMPSFPLAPPLQFSNEIVNLYQIFLCLAVFSVGPIRAKTRFCFDIFDVDRSGSLQLSELRKFIFMIAESLFLIGEMTELPQEALLDQVVEWSFKVRGSVCVSV